MYLYEYLQLVHQFLGEEESRSDFVKRFFTDVTSEDAPEDANPFIRSTHDYVNRIYSGTRNFGKKNVAILQPHLSGERFQALLDAVITSKDVEARMIEAFAAQGEDIEETNIGYALSDLLARILRGVTAGTDNPKPSKQRRQQTNGAVTIKGTASKDVSIVDGVLHVGDKSVELPAGIAVAPEVADHELKYTTQLCLAFTDHFGRTITSSNVDDDVDCGQHYKEQRQHYYNADAIRAMLEYFPDGTDEFAFVKNETYTGIQPAWLLAAQDTGFSKLLRTQQQAGQLALNKSKIAELFGQSEISGVCHILVNDDRIWWVKP